MKLILNTNSLQFLRILKIIGKDLLDRIQRAQHEWTYITTSIHLSGPIDSKLTDSKLGFSSETKPFFLDVLFTTKINHYGSPFLFTFILLYI